MSKAVRLLLCAVLMMSFSSTASAESFAVGDQGTEVAEIQGQLASLGYDVTADGNFGSATAEAVKSFQKAQGMDVDGEVGAQTYSALMGRQMPEVSRGSNAIGRRIVQNAMEYMGVPYVFGGVSPGGFDCSGYVRYIYASAGIYLPRMADEQYEVGTPVSQGNLRAGDMVFFETYEPGASHVGIYLSEGNFIHASSSRGVVISSLYEDYYASTYIGARRVM